MKKLVLILMVIIINASCDKGGKFVNDSYKEDKTYRVVYSLLDSITRELSIATIRSKEIRKMFYLTDIGTERKVSFDKVRDYLIRNGVPVNDIKTVLPNDSFILFIRNEWFSRWEKDEVEPYFTFDPMIDEEMIKEIPLYKNGKVVKTILVDDFNKYPIVVLSPEWWEGDTVPLININAIANENSLHSFEKNENNKVVYSIPFIEGLFISKCFDPILYWCNPMEIYVVTRNVGEDYRDTTDFTEVDYPQRWYPNSCSDSYCSFLYGFHRRVYYHDTATDTFYFLIKERDSGCRGEDDYVGYFMEYRLFGPHYIPGSFSKIWIYIDRPFK